MHARIPTIAMTSTAIAQPGKAVVSGGAVVTMAVLLVISLTVTLQQAARVTEMSELALCTATNNTSWGMKLKVTEVGNTSCEFI